MRNCYIRCYFLERLDNLDIILRGSQVIVHDPVAQVDRVSVSEAGGHEFDSHRDHHNSFFFSHAKVAKLVDAQASGVCTARREGSSPFFRTTTPKNPQFLILKNTTNSHKLLFVFQ